MRALSTFIIIIILTVGGYWAWNTFPNIKNRALDLFNNGKFQTLEVRHSAESIMESHKRELLKDSDHAYLEPDLKFHPYLLMEVKYSKNHEKTGEGIILWSMVDGEMVISTNSWEKTHGFTDCISAGADRQDFKIINALALKGGSMDRESLSKYLNVDNEVLDKWLDTCRKKNLIVQTGNSYRLHLQNPKMEVMPETRLDQWLVTKPSKNANRITKRYSSYQIENIAFAAFGKDFTVRKTTEIFLPVYSVVVQNPDGSQMTSYWNALNGKRLSQTYHLD